MTPRTKALTSVSTALFLAAGLVSTTPALAADQAAAATSTLTKNEAEGKKIVFTKSIGNCLACHKIADGTLPGAIGPALIAMKIRYPHKEDLFKVVWDPRHKFGSGTIMPPFGANKILTKEQIEKVVDYLYTL